MVLPIVNPQLKEILYLTTCKWVRQQHSDNVAQLFDIEVETRNKFNKQLPSVIIELVEQGINQQDIINGTVRLVTE